MSEFDRVGEAYEELVEDSIAFAGREHEFYLRAKADALVDVVRRLVGEPSTVRAVDVGCGDGSFDRLLPPFARLEGVDPSSEMIEVARRRNPRASYSIADGTALPYADGEFDVAFAVCVLHHVEPEDRTRFASELGRVLRPGGLAVVFEHNPLNPLTRLAVHRCAFDEDVKLLGRREVEQRLSAVGLRPVERRYLLFVPWRAPRLERLLAHVPLGAQHYVAATA